MRYMGSKARHVKDFLPIILAERKPGQLWCEPFVGGGNVICHVEGPRVGYDSNPYVVALLKAVRDGYAPPRITKAVYDDVRARPDSYSMPIVGWVGACCSFGAKWMGGFAKSTGAKPRDSIDEALRNILKQAPLLKGCMFAVRDYHDAVIPKGALIYADPPYAGTTNYGKQQRADGKFSRPKFDHAEFWRWADSMVDAGRTVFVSEYTAPLPWTCVWEKKVTANWADKRPGGAPRIERLFTRKANAK